MKKLSLLLALVMVLTMGLGGIALAEERTTLKITTYQDFTNPIDGLIAFDEMENRLNVDIDLTRLVVDDMPSKQTVALTTMDMGDIWQWEGATSEMNKYGDMGAFVNFLDYKDKMPNMFAAYEKYADEVAPLYSSETGAMYAAFRIYAAPYANEGTMIRQDIVEELGYTLEEITNKDKLTEVLYAMKKAYPDSTPLIGVWGLNYAMQTGLRGNNTNTGNRYNMQTGKYEYAGITDECREVIEWYAQLVKDGVCDPNFNMADEEYKAALVTGKAMCTYFYANACGDYNVLARETDPDATWTAIRMPAWNEDGFIDPLGNWQVFTSRGWCIPTNSKNIDKAIEYIDYLYSEEGSTLTCWGVEGVTFETLPDGTRKYMEPIMAEGNVGTVSKTEFGLGWSVELVRLFAADAYDGSLDEATKIGLANTRADSVSTAKWPSLVWTDEQKEERANIKTPVDTYVQEHLAKFVTGELDIATEWDAFVEGAKEMGAEKVAEMYNERLEEYKAAKVQ